MNTELERRQQIERDYHNKKYKDDDSSTSSVGVNPAYEYFQSVIDSIPQGKVLDFGCGDGWASMIMAKKGFDVYGIDISIELINRARKIAKEMNLTNFAHFDEMAGEDLKFEENYFDFVFGSAVLHHTDFNLALNNIHRVLKPGGKGLFIEPMNQNILLKIWRFLTPWRRSPTEKALTTCETNLIKYTFPAAKLNFFIFTSMFSAGLIKLFPHVSILNKLNLFLIRLDHHLINLFPFLGKYCAVVVIELIKD
jgi:2-polyprenyl-3-methyl-5-hydroxy-6-metoxy-1,4-benzoquinol methylase